MAKKSRRRPLRSEKDPTGCISGLIRIFDFRNGRSTRKLLPDRRRVNKQAMGSTLAKSMLTESDIGFQETKVDADSGMTSVKKLMEGEMYDDGDVQEVGIEKRYPECIHTRQGRGRNSKNSNKACKRCNEIINLWDLEAEKDLGSGHKSFDQLVSKNSSDGFDFEIIMHLLHDDFDQHLDQVSAVDKGKLTAAIKIFIDQSSSDSKHFLEGGQIQDSEEFRDALQRLSLNRDLLLKLLEGSQVRENLRSNSLPRTGLLREKVQNSKTDELIGQKPTRNLFRRRSKSQECFPSTGTENTRHPSKIVILKPGPEEVDVNPAIQVEKSHFSFTDFKRKLKNAVTKRHNSDKGGSGENSGWSSPNRNHFYVEKFAKPSKKKANESEEVEKSDMVMSPGVSSIYLEAKKHLVEMLNSGEHSAELKSQQLPRSLGRILSFSEYYNSPMYSPRKASSEILVTEARTPSPRNSVEIVNELANQPFQENLHNSEIKLCSTEIIPDEKLDCAETDKSLPIECSDTMFDEKTCSSGFDETQNDNPEVNDIHSSQLCSDSKEDGQSGDCNEEFEEDSIKQSSKMETCDDCQTLCSPSSSPSSSSSSSSKTTVSIKVEDMEAMIDRMMERPSPVSVLEPLFADDDISPARTISTPGELEIQPRKIQFEECVQTSLEDESAFEYVEAVLLGSGLNWDEYLLRWLSSSTILEPSLYDEVELFSSRSHNEQKLLFDCINEVLEEVCQHYFGSFPLASLAKKNHRPVPMRMDLINEIWSGVEGHILQHPSPQSLDRLLKKDMGSCKKWMNIESDIKSIGAEIGETILDNLMEETVLAFLTRVAPMEVLEQ